MNGTSISNLIRTNFISRTTLISVLMVTFVLPPRFLPHEILSGQECQLENVPGGKMCEINEYLCLENSIFSSREATQKKPSTICPINRENLFNQTM